MWRALVSLLGGRPLAMHCHIVPRAKWQCIASQSAPHFEAQGPERWAGNPPLRVGGDALPLKGRRPKSGRQCVAHIVRRPKWEGVAWATRCHKVRRTLWQCVATKCAARSGSAWAGPAPTARCARMRCVASHFGVTSRAALSLRRNNEVDQVSPLAMHCPLRAPPEGGRRGLGNALPQSAPHFVAMRCHKVRRPKWGGQGPKCVGLENRRFLCLPPRPGG